MPPSPQASGLLACEKFSVGQRVMRTPAYPKNWREREYCRSDYGTVTRFSRDGMSVHVKRDGTKSPGYAYPPEFWVVVGSPEFIELIDRATRDQDCRDEAANRKYVFAMVSPDEQSMVYEAANRNGLSAGEYIRRAINAALFDENENAPLLVERDRGRRKAESERETP